MDYALIGKIEKAKLYAEEQDRIQFNSFAATISGDHTEHSVTFNEGTWHCDCGFFQSRGYCSHSMAMERVLEGMLPEPVAEPEAA